MNRENPKLPLSFSHASTNQSSARPSLGLSEVSLPNQHGELLVVSPYSSQNHLLKLQSIGKPQQLLAKALSVMEPLREDYATAPYVDAFNWNVVANALKSLVDLETYAWKQQSFYIVVFRSQLSPTTDGSHLGALDMRSHAEAMESGGLLKYWFGNPDVNGRNLATCEFFGQTHLTQLKQLTSLGIWRDYEDAKRGSLGHSHKEAIRATIHLYSEWKLERLLLTIGDNVTNWAIRWWDQK